MSALPSKGDIQRRPLDVPFGPTSDITVTRGSHATSDGLTLWTMVTPKLSILSCRDKPDAQDIQRREDIMINSKRRGHTPSQEFVAGNGLINRRALLGHGIAIAGAMS